MKSSKVSIEDQPHNLPYLYELRSDLQKAIRIKPENIDLKNFNIKLKDIIALREQNTELSQTERVSILINVSNMNLLISETSTSNQIYHHPTDSREDYHSIHDIPVSTGHYSCFSVIFLCFLGLNNDHSDI